MIEYFIELMCVYCYTTVTVGLTRPVLAVIWADTASGHVVCGDAAINNSAASQKQQWCCWAASAAAAATAAIAMV